MDALCTWVMGEMFVILVIRCIIGGSCCYCSCSMLVEIRDVVLEVRVCKNLIICYDLSCCCWLLMTRIMVILVDVSLILIQCCWLELIDIVVL